MNFKRCARMRACVRECVRACVRVCVCERETERQRERQRDRDRYRDRDRDRQTEIARACKVLALIPASKSFTQPYPEAKFGLHSAF